MSDPFLKVTDVIGRQRELNQLERVSRNLGSLHLLVKGPRGIGKTRLLDELIKKVDWNDDKTEPSPFVFKVSLTPLDTCGQVVQRILIAQDTKLRIVGERNTKINKEKWGQIAAKISNTLAKSGSLITSAIGAAGNSLLGKERDAYVEMDAHIDAFCSGTTELITSVRDVLKEQGNNALFSGVIVILDEADTVDSSRFQLATFIKLAHEQFSAFEDCKVSFVVAGLDDVDDRLLESHPSALRLLEVVEIAPFPEPGSNGADYDARRFVNEFIAKCDKDDCSVWREDERAMLTRLGEGIPFWVQRIAYYAYSDAKEHGSWVKDEAGNDTTKIIVAIPHILAGYEKALREVGRAACQAAVAPSRSADARRLISCLAFSGQRGLEKSELVRIAGLSDDKTAEPALREVVATEAVRSNRTSAGTMIRFVTEGYQRWLSEELGAFDIVDSMPSLTQSLHDLRRPIVFTGEDVPAFNGVKDLFDSVVKRLGFPSRSAKVEFNPYSHEYLFATLGASPIIESLTDGSAQRLAYEKGKHQHSLAELWEKSDVIALPSYLLSEAYRMGIHNLDELTGELGESGPWRRYLEAATIGFFNTCVFNNSWVALPFTLIPKLYYSYGFDPNKDHANGILLEGKAGSLPLAYLWTEFAQRNIKGDNGTTGALFEFDRRRMDVTFASRENSIDQWLEGNLNSFENIVVASHVFLQEIYPENKAPSISWDFPDSWREPGPTPQLKAMQEKKLTYYGWADWYVQIHPDVQEELSVSVHPPKLTEPGKCCSIIRSSESEKNDQVWADSWILVFPKNKLTKSHIPSSDALAAFRVFMALMAPDWQSDFQGKTGVSPFRSVLKSTRSWRKFPWLKDLDPEQIRLMSEGGLFDHYRMQAKVALLSNYLKATTDDKTELLKNWEGKLRRSSS